MSSTQKGNKFELKVYNFLKDLVANDDFYVPGKKSEVFYKKKYHSARRNADIIFDITIETCLAPGKPYSLLTIVECKNYAGTIGVEDIEEFESKIRQVGEHNTKGVIVTNTTLQEGALNLVKSFGLGLMRLKNNDQYQWINYRKDKDQSRLDLEKTNLYFTQDADPSLKFVGLCGKKLFHHMAEVLVEAKIIDFYIHKEKYIQIPYLTDEKIESIAQRLYQYPIDNGSKLDIDKVTTFLSSVYPITFDFDTALPNGILGKINFDPLKISISSALKSDPHRWRFTFAHELGHLVLHQKILQGIAEKTDNEFSLGSTERLEFQANIFASLSLLPEVKLRIVVKRYFESNRIYKKIRRKLTRIHLLTATKTVIASQIVNGGSICSGRFFLE